MPRIPSRPKKASRLTRAECESVQFVEVEFVRPVVPRLVIQFSGGISVLLEDESAVGLAAEFITAFRAYEKGGAR